MTARRAPTQAREMAAGVHWLPLRGANVYFVRSEASWVLIDAGWQNSADLIHAAAESLFGPHARPAAILLTHAHPDHLGAAAELARLWEVPVTAHRADLPLLTGDVLDHLDLVDPIGRFAITLMRLLPRRTSNGWVWSVVTYHRRSSTAGRRVPRPS